uniref:Uncharacterized protein n=1 Tax=Knipowitschia caucasica TaxID=637954 RepID=A0AAV2MHC8_KNICA
MAGSSVLNQRQHVGLQKLVALSGITTAFLGPSKTYKIIQDDVTGESTLVSSCHRLLQNLELTCAVGQLVYETVEAHHTRYKTDTKSGLATVVLTSWVEGKLPCEEDAFWACAYRLHWALKDAFLLPGVGGTELLCIRQLQEQAGVYANSCKPVPLMNPRSAAGPDRGVVLQLMAEGLMDFVSGVMVNTGEFSKVEARTVAVERLRGWDGRVNRAEMNGDHESRICDNLSVKQEAWRTALDLVFLVLQTDAEIITGVGQERSGQKELMFL